MIKKRALIVFICFFSLLFHSFSQEALKSIEEEYYDFLSLTGVVDRPTLGYRTLSDSVWKLDENEPLDESSAHIWKENNLGRTFTLWEAAAPADNWFTRGIKQGLTARIYGPEWFNSYNTHVPYGQNDGALWQGRGYNTSLTAGVRLEGFGFEATFKPQVSWMENREFEFVKSVQQNQYGYFVSGIDLVQRFGDSSFFNFNWEDSEIRWTWHSITLGFGSQNSWLGPSYLNPMLGSNNAGGYAKFDIGLRKTDIILPYLGWNIGSIEGRIWNGQLKESDYYDDNLNNDKRMLNALSVSYCPSFIPGFTINLNRVFITYWRKENFKYLWRLFTNERSNALSSSGNDEDQKVSLALQWIFPKAGFSFYGEFGRDDFSSSEETNPFHTAIYTIGAKQNIPLPFGLQSELILEWNDFEMSQDFQMEWPYIGFYGHGFVRQGYTHNGQIIGAGSSYFGNSQFLIYKVYFPKGCGAFIFHRYCPDNNYIYSKSVNTAVNEELKERWFDIYETFYVIGGELSYYITNNFLTYVSFSVIDGFCLNYEKNGIYSFNIKIQLKYSF